MRQNTPHDTDPIHSLDHVPKTCWTCVYWVGGDVSNHLCSKYPGETIVSLDPCNKYALWEEWLFVEWFYPPKKKVQNREYIN